MESMKNGTFYIWGGGPYTKTLFIHFIFTSCTFMKPHKFHWSVVLILNTTPPSPDHVPTSNFHTVPKRGAKLGCPFLHSAVCTDQQKCTEVAHLNVTRIKYRWAANHITHVCAHQYFAKVLESRPDFRQFTMQANTLSPDPPNQDALLNNSSHYIIHQL